MLQFRCFSKDGWVGVFVNLNTAFKTQREEFLFTKVLPIKVSNFLFSLEQFIVSFIQNEIVRNSKEFVFLSANEKVENEREKICAKLH